MADMTNTNTNTNTNTIEVECAMPFTWAVDTAIRSDTSSDFGASRLHSFASVVDSAIRSSPASSFSISTLHAFPFPIITDRLPHEHTSALLHDYFDNLLNRRSFRINAEFDRMIRSLGLSGPEDLAIPTAAWEEAQAHKARVVSPPVATVDLQQPRVEIETLQHLRQRESGINGVRPPVLQLPPVSSTWNTPPQTESEVLSDDDEVESEECCYALDYDFHNNPLLNRNGTLRLWEMGEMIGRGTFGSVYEGITEDGFFFAVKEVPLLDDGSLTRQSIFQLQQEISLLRHFKHENIVQYLGTDMVNDKLYIFLELVAKGSLANLYRKYQLTDSQVSKYTSQILNGLKYLHYHNMVHREIKCGNILVDINGSVKLANFGLAKLPFFSKSTFSIQQLIGSVYWMAPEMQAMFRIGRGELPYVPESLSRDARDFILKCLQVNPNDRPTAAQLLDHPFVREHFYHVH